MTLPFRTAAAATVLLLGLAACGEPDVPDPDPTPTAPTTSTSTTSDPTPTSTVVPATGVEISTSRFSFRAPEGFEKRSISGELIGSVADLLPDDTIYFSVLEDYRDATLDEMAQTYLDSSSAEILPKKQPDTEIDGRPVFHLSGPVSDRAHDDVYGLITDGAGVIITFDIHSPAARRKEIIESTLATFTWK